MYCSLSSLNCNLWQRSVVSQLQCITRETTKHMFTFLCHLPTLTHGRETYVCTFLCHLSTVIGDKEKTHVVISTLINDREDTYISFSVTPRL